MNESNTNKIITYDNSDDRNNAINSGEFNGKHIKCYGNGIDELLTIEVVE